MAIIAAVLLAAGESTRVGELKQLLPIDGKPLVQYQVSALARVGVAPIVVVLGHRASEMAPSVRGSAQVSMVINSGYRTGKSSSIKVGLAEVPSNADGVLIIGVDQPRPTAVLNRLVQEHIKGQALITMPEYRGKGGHPIIFSVSLMPELLSVREETMGLRHVVLSHRKDVHRLAFNTSIVLLDINTMEDYHRAQKLLEG